MKIRRSAIKTCSVVKSTSHAFVKDMHDEPTTTQREEDESIADNFIASYASARSLFQQAVTTDRETFSTHVHDFVDTIKDPTLLPPETAVRAMYATMNGAKGASESGWGPDLFKAAAKQLAALPHPLYVKAVSLMRLGMTLKVGMGHPLDKKTNATAVKQKRNIRLECPPVKKLSSWLRKAALPAVNGIVADTQFGSGLNQGSTEMAYMAQLAAEGAGGAQLLTSVALYIDIASAFAEVHRCLVADDFKSRQTPKAALLRYQLVADMVDGIIAEVVDTGFECKHGATEHLERMLPACLENLFATFEGAAGGSMPQGTGAGTPLADLLFAVAFCKAIALLRRKLQEAGLIKEVTIAGLGNFGDWASDDGHRHSQGQRLFIFR